MKVQFSSRISNKEHERNITILRGVKAESRALGPLRADHRVDASLTVSSQGSRDGGQSTVTFWYSQRLLCLQ